jgi:hypothetical protein
MANTRILLKYIFKDYYYKEIGISDTYEIKNTYGEEIYLKIEFGQMFIHHTDITKGWETLEHTLMRWSISQMELDSVIEKFKEIININK